MAWHYLDLVDYLLIAEAVLDVPASDLAQLQRIDLADSALNAPAAGFGEVEAYPDFESKAAVLCWHLVRNHPLPDGNKRAAFMSMLEFCARNGKPWRRGEGDPAETESIIKGVAGGSLSQQELEHWILSRISDGAT